MERTELKVFENSDDDFYAIKRDEHKDVYNLEYGDDFHSGLDMLSDEDLIVWCLESYCSGSQEHFNEYRKEDGSVDIEMIKKSYKEQEADYPPSWTYPAGRAYDRFENYIGDIPDTIDIELVDGYAPGIDGLGVIVDGYESLVALQVYFESLSLKINFIIVEDH